MQGFVCLHDAFGGVDRGGVGAVCIGSDVDREIGIVDGIDEWWQPRDDDEIGFGGTVHESADIAVAPEPQEGTCFDAVWTRFEGCIEKFDAKIIGEREVAFEVIIESCAIGDDEMSFETEISRHENFSFGVVYAADEG